MATTGLKPRLIVSILMGAGIAISMAFNSCSDVKFSEALSNPAKGGDGYCPEGTTANGCTPVPPPRLVNYDDTFVIPLAANKADVLLVLDNSGSMSPDLQKLAAKMDGLIEVLDAGGVDWQMCHVLTDLSEQGLARTWNTGPAGERVLKPSTPNKALVLTSTMDRLPKNGSGNEQAILAIRAALSNADNLPCFRADAALAVVIISDEDEKSCGGRCKDWQSSEIPTATQYRDASRYRNQYRDLVLEDDPSNLIDWVKTNFNNKTFIAHSIVIRPGDASCYDAQDRENPAFFGVQYSRLQAQTGGILGDICAASYATQLTDMGKRTREAINSVTLRCAPVTSPTVQVSPAAAGLTWTVQGNKIIFSAPVVQGTQVRVKYTCAERQ